MRKYYYGDDLASSIKEENFIPISLITGCAFFFPIDLIENEKLFTEKYFFGEEILIFLYVCKKEELRWPVCFLLRFIIKWELLLQK